MKENHHGRVDAAAHGDPRVGVGRDGDDEMRRVDVARDGGQQISRERRKGGHMVKDSK